MTRQIVDGFALMPPIVDQDRWVGFVDWNGDGRLDVAEVAAAVCAMLPVDENKVERLVRQSFDRDGDGFISQAELETTVLPYLRQNCSELTTSMASAPPPEITRVSDVSELTAWFKHWDADASGHLDMSELRFALTSCFHQALASSIDASTKQTIIDLFLREADLDGDGHVSHTEFLTRFVPLLQANLPDALTTPSSGNNFTGSAFRVRLMAVPDGRTSQVELPLTATVGDLRAKAQIVLACEDSRRPPLLIVAGRRLEKDIEHLAAVRGVCEGNVVQAMRPAAPQPGKLWPLIPPLWFCILLVGFVAWLLRQLTVLPFNLF